ncbi:MAG: Fis family transcriptional regulator [Candidatus Thiothrix singaporensis]|uniref:Putative Fis-like DNA-binding protein n=3 Tax=Thiothrix TaxID=1030 RepID=A0A656H8P0_THINJ|nr:helix-turn-helix domain-containing protein [Thiothrix nivea]EIJ32991.1 transcriptional regulator, Fis family [Thiothrix nivea DSM 5205]QLQ31752.1 MAG: Fis family transcriptional regulator [Candidatus Thiothrix singaporensis]
MTNTSSRVGLDSSLSETVARTLQDYLDTLGDHEASNIYRLVLDEVERPMLEIMMRYTHGNQSKAAQCMGINRATLRTKLKRHNLL